MKFSVGDEVVCIGVEYKMYGTVTSTTATTDKTYPIEALLIDKTDEHPRETLRSFTKDGIFNRSSPKTAVLKKLSKLERALK